jgi:intracellular sulfur oxidation DsrE/DsrF family protein
MAVEDKEQHAEREVVIQVSDAADQVENAVQLGQRMQSEISGLKVRVIVHGGALAGVVGDAPVDLPDRVQVQACQFGLTKHGYELSQLRAGVDTVPGASTAIVEAQLNGAAYLKL